MSRDTEGFLHDIAERCTLIQSYLLGLNFTQFDADQRTIDAIERCFQIIGEAIKQLPADLRESEPGVEWSGFARFRDIITHAYFRLDREEVWNAATLEVPLLLDAVLRLLSDET